MQQFSSERVETFQSERPRKLKVVAVIVDTSFIICYLSQYTKVTGKVKVYKCSFLSISMLCNGNSNGNALYVTCFIYI